MMRKVKALRQGDTVGLIAPSSPAPLDDLEKAVAVITDLGFNVKVGASCYESYGYMAGPEGIRVQDMHAMFDDPKINGIFCVRGGDGAIRLPRLIDMELIFKNPKVFLGYSDITVLHLMFNLHGQFCTFHGPMPSTDMIKGSFSGYEKDYLLKAICNDEPIGELKPYDGASPMQTLVEGTAEGETIGGNLSLVCALMGTPWEIDTKDRILILEDIDEPLYKIDRMLTQLLLGGKLETASGIVLGQFTNITHKDPERTFTLDKIFEDVVAKAGRPTLINGYFGHGEKKVTLPLGARAVIDGANSSFTIIESGVVG
ncbi:LD-carboxypeptidase [Acetomicrobium sp.]|jgi:muramoyltetrapeptide carboxypeptidase|uniref:S66 peptidase family protein n=1 Tax=Acetomicrobium sp. TaxID=1872099 RepID=UPI002B25E58B|nr:LD-carboxypeptidase [Acetomicrobium sp.]HOM97327.1 LD-carboxypeptidase [Acetomicrobium sp.]